MRALIIGPEEKEHLRAAYERARAKPVPWETVKRAAAKMPNQGDAFQPLANRPPDWERPPSEMVELPIGYRVNISFEEQPAGILAHISISIDSPGNLPHIKAIMMIIDELGFDASKPDLAWVEEFLFNDAPGGLAANMLFMVEPRAGPEARQ